MMCDQPSDNHRCLAAWPIPLAYGKFIGLHQNCRWTYVKLLMYFNGEQWYNWDRNVNGKSLHIFLLAWAIQSNEYGRSWHDSRLNKIKHNSIVCSRSWHEQTDHEQIGYIVHTGDTTYVSLTFLPKKKCPHWLKAEVLTLRIIEHSILIKSPESRTNGAKTSPFRVIYPGSRLLLEKSIANIICCESLLRW